MTDKNGTVRTLQDQLKAFERQAVAERTEARELRRDGVGLLTPALLKENIRNGTDLVLAYGKKGAERTFSLADLKRFVEATARAQETFKSTKRGVLLAQLEKSSLPVDIERSKTVRNATLYKVLGNLLFFQVSGNSQPQYQVRIRLEDWDKAVHATDKSPLALARAAALGRLSIDCSCGRHQYWYRYLAGIGGFDVNPPKEQDYPKIRNRNLTGCCCKHVLKVFGTLRKSAVHAVLVRELERQSARKGFADDRVRARFLNADELQKTAKEALKALKSLKSETANLHKELKPRTTHVVRSETAHTTPSDELRRNILKELRPVVRMAKDAKKLGLPEAVFSLSRTLEAISANWKQPVEVLQALIKEEQLL